MAAIRLVEVSPGRFEVSPALAQMPSSSADIPDIRLVEVSPGTFQVSPALAQMPGTWVSSKEDGNDNMGEDFDVDMVSGCADSRYCAVCDRWLNGESQFMDHTSGQKHRKLLKRAAAAAVAQELEESLKRASAQDHHYLKRARPQEEPEGSLKRARAQEEPEEDRA